VYAPDDQKGSDDHQDDERYLGVKIPPSNLKPDYLEQAQAFANELADRVYGTDEPAASQGRASSRAGST